MINTDKVRKQVAGLSSDNLKWKTGDEYNSLNKNEFLEKMGEKYSYLKTNSSTLFDMCINGTIDMPRVEQMLLMIEQVNNGKDYNTASQEIGQSLTDHYVKPIIDKLDSDKLENDKKV
jgi:hypothetical protein